MGILEKIIGPKSKYDKTLPYTYEARVRVFEDGADCKSYFSDTICGLIEYLTKNRIHPDTAEIFEIYADRETPIDARLFTSPDNRWLYKPEICRTFEQHYKGHIHDSSCSFKDRERHGIGP